MWGEDGEGRKREGSEIDGRLGGVGRGVDDERCDAVGVAIPEKGRPRVKALGSGDARREHRIYLWTRVPVAGRGRGCLLIGVSKGVFASSLRATNL